MAVIWFWVVLVLFSIVETKIVHYSSLLYFPGAFLAAFCMEELMEVKRRLKWDQYVVYGLGILVFGVALALVNVVANFLPDLAAQQHNPFAQANLRAEVEWSGWEFLPGALFAVLMLVNLTALWRKKFEFFLGVHLFATPLFLNALNLVLVPKISGYTQEAVVSFYQEKSLEDAYLMVEGYKSYAHYFYGRRNPFPHPEIPKEERGEWLARGEVDKPVYLVTRLDKVSEEFEQVWFAEFRKLYERNGFVFYRRDLPQEGKQPPLDPIEQQPPLNQVIL